VSNKMWIRVLIGCVLVDFVLYATDLSNSGNLFAGILCLLALILRLSIKEE
jgi:hypothetical protein